MSNGTDTGKPDLLPKVKLYTAEGEFVAEAYSLPFQSWPQSVWWEQRIFVRENFRDLSHVATEPPAYYEVTSFPVYSKEDLAKLGIV